MEGICSWSDSDCSILFFETVFIDQWLIQIKELIPRDCMHVYAYLGLFVVCIYKRNTYVDGILYVRASTCAVIVGLP